MRRAVLIFKAFIVTAVAIACAVFVYLLLRISVFPAGERHEFYKGSSSDEIVLARTPYEKLFLSDVKGESVRYSGDRAKEMIDRYQAKILFTEEAAGVVNYYCYSPLLQNAVLIGEEKVNLHIATSGSQTAAGTPVIFGGF